MRILVFAYQEIGYLCLKYLLEKNENVIGLFTYKNKKDENIWFRTPSQIAEKYNIPVYYDADLNSEKIKKLILQKLKPDIVFSFYFREKIPDYIINFPNFGAINLHGSYLPYFRGCAPLNWALVKGAKFTGATFHYMSTKFDAGDIISRCKFNILKKDDINSVYKKFHKYALILFKDTFKKIKNNRIKIIKQDNEKATYYGRRKPSDGLINWTNMKAEEIYNLIRAVTYPYPGAYTFYKNEKIIFWKSKVVSSKNNNFFPGEFIFFRNRFKIGSVDKKSLIVDKFNIPEKIFFELQKEKTKKKFD